MKQRVGISWQDTVHEACGQSHWPERFGFIGVFLWLETLLSYCKWVDKANAQLLHRQSVWMPKAESLCPSLPETATAFPQYCQNRACLTCYFLWRVQPNEPWSNETGKNEASSNCAHSSNQTGWELSAPPSRMLWWRPGCTSVAEGLSWIFSPGFSHQEQRAKCQGNKHPPLPFFFLTDLNPSLFIFQLHFLCWTQLKRISAFPSTQPAPTMAQSCGQHCAILKSKGLLGPPTDCFHYQ